MYPVRDQGAEQGFPASGLDRFEDGCRPAGNRGDAVPGVRKQDGDRVAAHVLAGDVLVALFLEVGNEEVVQARRPADRGPAESRGLELVPEIEVRHGAPAAEV